MYEHKLSGPENNCWIFLTKISSQKLIIKLVTNQRCDQLKTPFLFHMLFWQKFVPYYLEIRLNSKITIKWNNHYQLNMKLKFCFWNILKIVAQISNICIFSTKISSQELIIKLVIKYRMSPIGVCFFVLCVVFKEKNTCSSLEYLLGG